MKRAAILAIMAVFVLVGLATTSQAQRAYRLSEKEVKRLLDRIQTGSERFRSSLDEALDRSPINGSDREDEINRYVKGFEEASDKLEGRFDSDRSATADVQEVLTQAVSIDTFMMQHPLTPRAQEEWRNLRRSLDELAAAYSVTSSWGGVLGVSYRMTDDELRSLLNQMESDADRFRKSLADALDDTRFDDSSAEDEVNRYVKEFEQATDRLENRFGSRQSASSDAEEVLTRAARIDAFMRQHRLTMRAQEDWTRLRGRLDELATAYTVSWRWY